MNVSNWSIHEARREAVHIEVEAGLNANSQLPAYVRLGPIDAMAVATFKTSWLNATWDWPQYAAIYRQKKYARLELAIWSGSQLCGLALGKFSPACRVLQMNFVEGAPYAHPLKGHVLEIAVEHGIVLGTAYGSSVFRVTRPASHVQAALASYPVPFSFVAHDPSVPYCYSERAL